MNWCHVRARVIKSILIQYLDTTHTGTNNEIRYSTSLEAPLGGRNAPQALASSFNQAAFLYKQEVLCSSLLGL